MCQPSFVRSIHTESAQKENIKNNINEPSSREIYGGQAFHYTGLLKRESEYTDTMEKREVDQELKRERRKSKYG